MSGPFSNLSLPTAVIACLLMAFSMTGCVGEESGATSMGENANPASGVGTSGPDDASPGQDAGIGSGEPEDAKESGGREETNEDPVTRKYNPGHYIAMNGFDNQAGMLMAVQPGVRGVHKRYLWRDLEPSEGNYDFSTLESDLTLMADHGMQLIAMIEDKTFNATMPLPAYLSDYALENKPGGYTAKRWSPYLIERFSALVSALGERFDTHPAFEGVAFQESAHSIGDAVKRLHDYSAEAYRDRLIELLLGARESLPRSQVFWYMNFLDGGQPYLRDIASIAALADVAMGGPDVLPDNTSLTRLTYPLYEDFAGQLTLFSSMQYDSYAHPHADPSRPTTYWTMLELFEYARDRLHVNYLFWTRKPRPNPEDSWDWRDALPVIAANPAFN